MGRLVRFVSVWTATLTVGLVALPAQEPFPGWNLFNPLASGVTELVDLNGEPVHTWQAEFGLGAAVYLLEDGRLLRCSRDNGLITFGGAGVGGRLEILSWDSEVEWSYVAAGEDYVQHHDVERLPNGNILAIVWERFTREEAIAAGRDPATTPDEVWSEAILEIEPVGKTGGNIVWEWKVWDHLVQNFDPALPNFGDPADHPGKIDINYVGTGGSDWIHLNSIDYNAELDQIVIGGTKFDEVWVISHAPEDDGDLIYRYGNPQVYGRGVNADRSLWNQHNMQWIEEGLPGAGNLLIFNNGADDTSPRGFSSADEFSPPLLSDESGYELDDGEPYLPLFPDWSVDSNDGERFISTIMSGVQRLPNGNTFVSLGRSGELLEFASDGRRVWQGTTPPFVFRTIRIPTYDPRLLTNLWDHGASTQLTVINGVQFAGDLSDTFTSDDQRLDVRRGNGPVVFEIEQILSGFHEGGPAQIDVRLNARHALPAGNRVPGVSVTRELLLFNFETNQFEVVGMEASTPFDTALEVKISEQAGRFVEPSTGRLIIRIEHEKSGLVRGLRVLVDEVSSRFVY